MAVKPWKGVVDNSIPSNYKSHRGEADVIEINKEFLNRLLILVWNWNMCMDTEHMIQGIT